MKIGKFLVALTSLSLAGAAFAAAPVDVKAGAQVFDTSGASVGTVEAVTNGVATVSTGTSRAGVPVASFAQGDKGLVIGMTKAELDKAAADASARAAADIGSKLTAGAAVYGSDGTVAATVDSTDAQYVTLNVGAAKAKLPLSSLTIGAQGPQVGMTAAELKAAVAAQSPAQPAR